MRSELLILLRSYFCLAALKSFFIFVSWQFDYDVYSCGSLKFILHGTFFYKLRKFSAWFRVFFLPLSSLTFWDSHYVSVSMLMISHSSLRLCSFSFFHSFFFLFLWVDNLNWLNFNFMDSFFYQIKSALEVCSEIFISVILLSNSRISVICFYDIYSWYSLFGDTSFSYFNSVDMVSFSSLNIFITPD